MISLALQPAPAAQPHALRLGGMTPMTSIDFPGRLAAVLYCQGCPWRCSYCHNPELLPASTPPTLTWEAALAFLRSRRGLLDGAVFSGGEPLAQRALPAAIAHAREETGMQTALHTGGMFPERLAALLPQLDWVGLDIKAPPAHYDAITRTPGSGSRAFASLRALTASNTPHECRTTWHTGLFPVDELMALAELLRAEGVRHWALQECRTPDAPMWALTSEQTAQLGAGFESFTLRRA